MYFDCELWDVSKARAHSGSKDAPFAGVIVKRTVGGMWNGEYSLSARYQCAQLSEKEKFSSMSVSNTGRLLSRACEYFVSDDDLRA